MKTNKTLISIIIYTIIINILFIISFIFVSIKDYKQPYFAIFITLFMFMYHINIRLILGFIISLFKNKIDINKKCYQISYSEYKRLCKLKIGKLKERYPTLFINQFKVSNSYDIIIHNNINAERVHLYCFIFSFLSIPLGILLSSDELIIYIVTALTISTLIDILPILIQRFNRYRLYRLKNHQKSI